MNSAADLGGICIALYVTALTFAQITNMGETGPWETDWIVISSEEATCPASLFTFSHALKRFTRDRDDVVTRFRLTKDSYPDQKRLFGIRNLCHNISSKYATSATLPASISMTNIRLSPETAP